MTTATIDVSRRRFLQGAGGLAFCLTVGPEGLRLISAAEASQAGQPINAWVRVAPDGTVTILSPGAEMGQGSMTSLAAIVAEEMDADWSKVAIEWATSGAFPRRRSAPSRAWSWIPPRAGG
jgi:isoquinoline 1-oxidoreductase beta subunit